MASSAVLKLSGRSSAIDAAHKVSPDLHFQKLLTMCATADTTVLYVYGEWRIENCVSYYAVGALMNGHNILATTDEVEINLNFATIERVYDLWWL